MRACRRYRLDPDQGHPRRGRAELVALDTASPIVCHPTRYASRRRRWLTTLAGLCVLAAVTAAPLAADEPIGSALIATEVAAARDALQDDPSLTAEERTRLGADLDQVLENLEALAQANDAALALRETQVTAPAQTATIRARLAAAAPLPDPPVDLPTTADRDAVQQRLDQEAAAVAAQQDRLTALEQALTEDAEALPTWRRQREELRQQAQDLDDELAGVLAAITAGADLQPRRWLLESQRDRLRAEALVLELKVTGAEASRALTQARRDEAQLALDQARARQAWLTAALDTRRRDEAAQLRDAIEAAQVAVADAYPPVRALAGANAELAEAIQAVDQRTAALTDALAATIATTAKLAQDFANDRQRVAAAGMSRALGRVLVDQRERLPNPRELRRADSERANAEAETTLAQLRWREERLLLQTGAEQRPSTILTDLQPDDAAAIEVQIQALQASRRELLERAIAAAEQHLNVLAESSLAAAALRTLTLEYDNFLAEHLLWLRSHVPLNQQSFAALPAVLAELLQPHHWLAVAQTLGAGLADAWSSWLGLAAAGLLLALQHRLRERIRATAAPLRRIRTDRFTYTLSAIALTLLLALPVPLLLALGGRLLAGGAAPDGFAYAVGEGLLVIAPGLYWLRVFRLLCMRGGVAEQHFRWRAEALMRLRRSLSAAIWGLPPLGLLSVVANRLGEIQAATLGRLALTAVILAFALLLAGALHPSRGVAREWLLSRPDGLANRARWLWYSLAVAVPLVLAGLALAGFQYTATTLFQLTINQLWLLLGLVVLHQTIVRWLLVTRRTLALNAVIERRRRRAAGGIGDDAKDRRDAEHEVDLAALDEHSRSLLNAMLILSGAIGLWLLSSDVLPALGVLQRIRLWQTTTLPVTLADLITVLIIATGAIIAVRHVPALLEVLLLKRTKIGAGGRYAIITLTSYAIITLAMLYSAGRLGFSWEQVQWLVAALGVGIGFGLKEIAANFIAGLILLFEQPVRVGDIVSIGTHYGEVTHIEARATTVRIKDRREVLVPNSQLITREVINWTLSDQVNRGEIRLSIEYGSDTQTALRILAEVAAADPRVLTDPAPVITVAEFGERGIELVFRYFLPTLTNRYQIRGELILAIDRQLRAAGIAIGLPQREVRLRNEAPANSPVAR